VFGDALSDGIGVLGAVDFDHADAETMGGTDGVPGDETVPGEAVGLRSGRVADAVPERRRSGWFAELVLAELGRGHHDEHPAWRVDDGCDEFRA
jgi:hypothetical protein